MKNKTKNILIGLFTAYCSCVLPLVALAQDIHFSQYNFSPLTLNPALTSAYKDLQATLQYKQQWKVVNAFTTAAATLELKLNQKVWTKMDNMTQAYKKKLIKGLAFGLHVFTDKAGDGNLKQSQANLSVAYHALINTQNTFSAGVMGGIAQHSFNPDAMRWNSQYSGGNFDPTMPHGENFATRSFIYGDYSAGLLWSHGEGSKYLSANDHKFFNAGVSIAHLSNPKQSFESVTTDPLHWKYTAHINTLIGMKNTNYSFGPSILFMKQGPLSELIGGMLIKYKIREESKYTGYIKMAAISVGCYYRNQDAVVPYFLLEMDHYSIGLSYDTNVSGLTAVTTGRGGFEISLRFNTPSPFLYQNKARI